MKNKLTCARSPCSSCPYRRDVPSGVWAANEYEKLIEYDAPMPFQPTARFDCHQRDGKLCAGWVASHGAHNLFALRLLAIHDRLDPIVYNYETDTPVFKSGTQAAQHGMKRISNPPRKAHALIRRLKGKIAHNSGE